MQTQIITPLTVTSTEQIAPPTIERIVPTESIRTPSTEPVQESTLAPVPVTTTTPNRTIAPMTDTSPELLLSSVVPSSIIAETASTLTLSGFGVQKAEVFSVLIGKTRITSFKVIDDKTIRLTVEARQMIAGTYDVTVLGSSNTVAALSPGLTVTSSSSATTTSSTPLR